MHQTAPPQDPESAFRRLTTFLNGHWRDQASVSLLTGARLARWVERPVLVDGIPVPIVRHLSADAADTGPNGGWMVTIHIPGGAGTSSSPCAEPAYIAAATCTWRGQAEPTPATIAAISAHARACAALTNRTAVTIPGDPGPSEVSRFGLIAAS